MDFQDKELDCIDCGNSFVFSAQDQEFFEQKGYSPRKRCKACALKKKLAKEAAGGE